MRSIRFILGFADIPHPAKVREVFKRGKDSKLKAVAERRGIDLEKFVSVAGSCGDFGNIYLEVGVLCFE